MADNITRIDADTIEIKTETVQQFKKEQTELSRANLVEQKEILEFQIAGLDKLLLEFNE